MLVIAVAGAVLPGTAYLLAGRIRLGLVVTELSISLLGGSAYAGLARRDDVIKWAPDPGLLLWVILSLALVAIAWTAVVISSYRWQMPEPPTALIVANNQMTIGAMRPMRDRGLSVPRDIALAAFDDFDWADLFSPRLTTIAQPHRELAAHAVELITTRIAHPHRPPGWTTPQPPPGATLIHGDSCGCQA